MNQACPAFSVQDMSLRTHRKVCSDYILLHHCMCYIFPPPPPPIPNSCIAIGLLNSKPDISKLLNDLVDIAWEWEAIAINLGLEVREIRGIEADITCKREESKLRKVLMKWSEKPLAKPFTWQTIIEVLKEPSLDQHHLADKIAERVSA